MLIDWSTVIAQMINFLVLIWLLKRYLYKPVLLAIDTREKSIASQISLAAASQATAQKSQQDSALKSAEFDQQKSSMLAAAQNDAAQERQKLMDEAQKDSDALRAKQDETLERERLEASREIVRLTCKEVFSVARKALSDLSSVSLEATMAGVLIDRIGMLSTGDKTQFAQSLLNTSQSVVVRSTFDLPEAQQNAIKSAVKENFDYDTNIEFKTEPDLVCGIELLCKSYKVSWSIVDYLNSLEKAVSQSAEAEHAA